MKRLAFLVTLLLLRGAVSAELKLPMKDKSVRFAVIGDSGTGLQPQFETARQMGEFRGSFPFDFVLMLGDNIYGSQTAEDYRRKFEEPYQALLSAGVEFHAALGNHDNPNQRFYKPFHMDGKRYYSFKKGDAEFFALDSNYMDAAQLQWFQKELEGSNSKWKICYFHHPLYSHTRDHGADTDLRKLIEPLMDKYGVELVLAGHEHSYQRMRPQKGITYITLGNSGQLRPHNLKASADIEKGFESDNAFGLFEIAGDELYFQIVSRTGETVDFGVIKAKEAGKSD